ncbi:sigma-70 region 4 domain-containing protein [Leptospira meyeri]|uniref:sigma-70 region 4 domain-containing protein n=1 Tax=Leptospira meyeri TaxID=29508 RepID=UPI000C2AD2A3|nr:sigma-70 region 4 domain-containing protein [Leptospira meyeri]PJZ82062.1 RNA polymerase subunit sigma-70 [Leptospira meyeri]PJZ97567.1 RNA polymerase subunit sigma-70 [Leptospira meyeri]PKA12340.1 RNA polymerase subunit sigma-70 [Leptospira meyeri]PKA27524.1 RNA polymerase subunit sigma-70 [Leptospira sp. mixed culture ATI2-C-A1]
MLPRILDEKILPLIAEARANQDLNIVKEQLPIWMVDRLAKKRKITEDESCEMVVTILEVFSKMWILSLNYHITNVLGFFVTYAFNQYRNRFRRTEISESGELYLQLWNYDLPANEENPIDFLDIENPLKAELEKLPALTALVLSLQFDLPMKQNLKQLLLWKLRETNHDIDIFYRDLDEKRLRQRQILSRLSGMITRYTRKLYEATDQNRRKWYLKQKKLWILRRTKTIDRSFLSEREIAKLLGISRKAVRNHLSQGKHQLRRAGKDLLYYA